MTKEWQTSDFGLACALEALGFRCIRLEPDGESHFKQYFVFKTDDYSYMDRLKHSYLDESLTVSALRIMSASRRIKNLLYSR